MIGGHGRAAERLAALEELELTVEKLVAGGDGMGRFESIPVFVPRSAPGDRLRVRLTERHPDYARAEVVEILAPGAGRREPPCPYFSRCGGCDLQHLEDERQVELKAAAVRETLERLGGVAWPENVEVVTGDAWGYRLRTTIHLQPAESSPGEGLPRVGYFARGSHDLVPVESCPILVPELEALLPRLPARLGEQPPRRLDLVTGMEGEVSCAPKSGDLPHGSVRQRVGDFAYEFDARVFFQAHQSLLEPLVEVVVGRQEGTSAVDLYAGAGLFSLPLASRYEQVTAVEVDAAACRYARGNARRNQVRNLDVVRSAADSWASRLPAALDRVVVDPPRRGLGQPLRRALLLRPPRHLTYVSCHPAALARDLKGLLAKTFSLESLTLIDLFPQSGHMEVVARLERA